MKIKIAVIGLGYVGLPLSMLFAKKFDVVGFDTKVQRIRQLKAGKDITGELEEASLSHSSIQFTSNIADIENSNFYIVAVPTPIDNAKIPDLSALTNATKIVASVIKRADTVVFESTVYPTVTENHCVPILEAGSGLTLNEDFSVGYSPERVNPGDALHTIDKIVKVTSGSNPRASELIDNVYSEIITAGTFKAKSIRVAEAAKVIENTQRDVNIALVNELSMIFEKMDIDTSSVLDAAETKWNFLRFRPGLVGGHCIGVDPYYLAHKAASVGHHPEVILAGRRVNDGMSAYLISRVTSKMMKAGFPVVGSRILVLGLSFKENCPDLRNSQIGPFVHKLEELNAEVCVHDPFANPDEALEEYGIKISDPDANHGQYDAVILAVPHSIYVAKGAAAMRAYGKKGAIFFDVKSAFKHSESDGRL